MQTAGYTRVRRSERYTDCRAAQRRDEAMRAEEERLAREAEEYRSRRREIARQAQTTFSARGDFSGRGENRFELRGHAQMPYVNSAMEPVFRETVTSGERVQLLRKRRDAESRRIRKPISREGVRSDVMRAVMAVLCLLLFTVWIANRQAYWSSADRVRRTESYITATETGIRDTQEKIDAKSAALNVPYEAVGIGMVASSSMQVVTLYAPADAITMPNGEIDPNAAARSASN